MSEINSIVLTCEIAYQPVGNIECWHVTGDCLEGAGIPNGSYILIDMGVTMPNRGDISLCVIKEGTPKILKKIVVPMGGTPYSALVTTVYADERKNPWFQVKSVHGAAYACVDCEGRLIREILVNTPPVDPFEAICPKDFGDINTAEGWNGMGRWTQKQHAWHDANKDNKDLIKYKADMRAFRNAQLREPGAFS